MTYFYIHVPKDELLVDRQVIFMTVTDLVSDSEDNVRRCQQIFDLVVQNFKTRRKFLELWPHVRYVAFVEEDGQIISCAFASTPMNWQIDYVVTRPDKRGMNLARAVTNTITNEARKRKVPYVMLTSRPELVHLYAHQCTYTIVGDDQGNVSSLPVMLETK